MVKWKVETEGKRMAYFNFRERKKRGRERGWYSGERMRGRMRKKRKEVTSVLIVNA